jgi:membrane peptidoglycan carboxypeptidase
MVQTGKIKKEQADEAKKVDIIAQVQEPQANMQALRAPYFVLSAKNELTSSNSYRATKTAAQTKLAAGKLLLHLDMNLQAIADKTVQDNRRNALSHGADSQALVAEDVKSGQMVAVVGGNDFNNDRWR